MSGCAGSFDSGFTADSPLSEPRQRHSFNDSLTVEGEMQNMHRKSINEKPSGQVSNIEDKNGNISSFRVRGSNFTAKDGNSGIQSSAEQDIPAYQDAGVAHGRRGGRESFNDWKEKNAPSRDGRGKGGDRSHVGSSSKVSQYAGSYAGSMSNYSMASSKDDSDLDFDDDATTLTNITTDSALRQSIRAATKIDYFQSMQGILTRHDEEEDEDAEDELFLQANAPGNNQGVKGGDDDEGSIDIPIEKTSNHGTQQPRNTSSSIVEKYSKMPQTDSRRPLSRKSGANEYSTNELSGASIGNYDYTDSILDGTSTHSRDMQSKDSLESYLPARSLQSGRDHENFQHELRSERVSSSNQKSSRNVRRLSTFSNVSKAKRKLQMGRIRYYIRRPNFKRNACMFIVLSAVLVTAISLGVYFVSKNKSSLPDVQPSTVVTDPLGNSFFQSNKNSTDPTDVLDYTSINATNTTLLKENDDFVNDGTNSTVDDATNITNDDNRLGDVEDFRNVTLLSFADSSNGTNAEVSESRKQGNRKFRGSHRWLVGNIFFDPASSADLQKRY